MASLFRNSRSIITRFASIHRTATTVAISNSGTQPKTSGATTNLSHVSPPNTAGNLAVRDAGRRSNLADPIRPRPAGESPSVPLVGKALNVWGQIGFGIVLALSAYFIYINYIINPEFYKSIKISREAGKRGSHEQPADRSGTVGQKIDDANVPKGEYNKHL